MFGYFLATRAHKNVVTRLAEPSINAGDGGREGKKIHIQGKKNILTQIQSLLLIRSNKIPN